MKNHYINFAKEAVLTAIPKEIIVNYFLTKKANSDSKKS